MRSARRAVSGAAAPVVVSGVLDRDGDGGDGVGVGGGRGRVAEIQRVRMLVAMAQVASERGVANATVAHVVERAGVSRRTFYEIFEDCEDCLLAALDHAVVCASERVLVAYRGEGAWRERIRASLLALLGFMEEEPSMARLLVVESLGAGQRALERRAHTIERLVAAVDRGREETGVLRQPIPLAAEGVVGAVLAVIHARLLRDAAGRLTDLLNPLMSIIVLPYLGAGAARRELQRPVSAGVRVRSVADNPLRDTGMRLTYRTVRVLGAVAVNPGSSNRMIADASEVGDQGQISKLLARLQRYGLIENSGADRARGEPNAWTLTERGQQAHNILTGHNRTT